MNPDALKPLSDKDKELNSPYHVGAYLTLPPLSQVPEEHVAHVPSEWILNQAEYDPFNDECAGCASSIAASLLDGERLDPHFPWMMARTRAEYTLEDFGCTNKDIALAWCKVGGIRFVDAPFTFKDARNKIADITNWDIKGFLPKAVEYRKSASVFWISPSQGYDAFDTWRAAVTKLNKMYPGKQHTCVFGLRWAYTSPNIETVQPNGTGHDTVLLGWKGGKAVLLNSQGPYSGDNGRFYVTREIFNKWAEAFGAFIMVDETPENIAYYRDNGVKLDDGWLTSLLKPFVKLIRDLLAKAKSYAS